jgi:hypothetical protein
MCTSWPADRAIKLEQQLRAAKRAQEEAELHLREIRAEAEELRHAKETAVVEREQGAVKGERRIKQLQVQGCRGGPREDGWVWCSITGRVFEERGIAQVDPAACLSRS